MSLTKLICLNEIQSALVIYYKKKQDRKDCQSQIHIPKWQTYDYVTVFQRVVQESAPI